MAEGFDHSEFDEYFDDEDDDVVVDDELKLPDPEIGGLSDIQELQIQTEELEIASVAKNKANNFFDCIEKEYGLIPSKINYDIFTIGKETGSLILKVGDKFIALEKRGKPGEFISLRTLVNNINKLKIGINGTNFVRVELGFTNYVAKNISQKAVAALQDVNKKMSEAEKKLEKPIELSTFSKTPDETPNEVETSLAQLSETLDWVLELPDVAEATTQTDGLSFRELQWLDKTMQTMRGELVNNLAKISYIDKDIAKEKQKLAQLENGGISDFDEDLKQTIEARIKNLEDERSARLEAASANKEALRSQISRIRETIEKVLHEDTTLAEKIKTLFREQGITIASVLTAFGMIIGLIVETVTGGGGATPGPSPGPSPEPSKGGVKEWIKKQLTNLGKLLASLAEKAAAALPGIIGSIVSWLLSTAEKVVTYAANNLWVLIVFVGGLLLAEAKKLKKLI